MPPDDRTAVAAALFAEGGGNLIGAAIGLAIAGPVGAIVGAATTPFFTAALKPVAAELQRRLLGPREVVRIAAALDHTLIHVQRRLDSGETPRSDGFVESSPDGRSAAEEIVEGVLRAAQREYEERKVPHLGALLASIAFTPAIDRYYANFLVRVAERLSYRQLVLLSFLSQLEALGIPTQRHNTGVNVSELAAAREDMVRELDDLVSQGLLDARARGQRTLFVPQQYSRTQMGAQLVRLMDLQSIDRQEFADLIEWEESAPTKYREA